jgi:hypothetical protein
MKRLFLVAGAFALLAASCGGGSAGSCADIVDDGMAVFQDLINEFDNMSVDDMQAFSTGDEPAFVADMQTKFDELDQRASDASCTDTELQTLFEERVPNLTAKTDFGKMMIEGISQSGLFN